MISSLQENMELLDGVQEVFEREDFDLMLLNRDDSLLEAEDEEDSFGEDKSSLSAVGDSDKASKKEEAEMPPVQKKVTMGRAIFISNPREKEEDLTEEERRERRNAKITQMMRDETSGEAGFDETETPTRDDYQFMKTNKQLFSEKIKRPPFQRNATSVMHRSS